jgi:hypothetical protein
MLKTYLHSQFLKEKVSEIPLKDATKTSSNTSYVDIENY